MSPSENSLYETEYDGGRGGRIIMLPLAGGLLDKLKVILNEATKLK